ncbi:MAG: MarR family transcriptional regulator [Pararhodobacter sp.]|nr:MarR family transcriptional regulator [Pararhodobacter sp.]
MDFDIHETKGNDSEILPLGSSFGNVVRHVNRRIQRDLGERIASLGLTLGQWYALRTLWVADGITQIEVAQRSGIAGPAMVNAIRSLIAMGLVSRKIHPEDRRKYIVSLTDRGRALEEPALNAAIEANLAAMNGISESEREVCLRVLRRAYQNLANNDIRMPRSDDQLDL